MKNGLSLAPSPVRHRSGAPAHVTAVSASESDNADAPASHRAPLAHHASSHASSHAIGLSTEGASVNIADLKRQSTTELRDIAERLGSVVAPGIPKHDLLFTVQQRLLDSGETLSGEGVLEVLPEGYGFLRSQDWNYLYSPDDIYVSTSQMTRSNLLTADTVSD